jgi:hypothetical protein
MVLARRIGYVFVLSVLLFAIPAIAQARFTSAVTGATSVSTDTLAPPTGASAAKACGFLNPQAQVTWTATADQYATGYVITRTGGGSSSTTTVTGRTTTSATVAIAFGTATTFTVTTTYRNWTSVATASTASVTCGLFG